MPRWFFSYRFVDEFAEQAVQEIARFIPVDDAAGSGPKAAHRRMQQHDAAVRVLRQKVAAFQHSERPNVFQKARLSQQLQNGLLARGYPEALAKEIALDSAGTMLQPGRGRT